MYVWLSTVEHRTAAGCARGRRWRKDPRTFSAVRRVEPPSPSRAVCTSAAGVCGCAAAGSGAVQRAECVIAEHGRCSGAFSPRRDRSDSQASAAVLLPRSGAAPTTLLFRSREFVHSVCSVVCGLEVGKPCRSRVPVRRRLPRSAQFAQRAHRPDGGIHEQAQGICVCTVEICGALRACRLACIAS